MTLQLSRTIDIYQAGLVTSLHMEKKVVFAHDTPSHPAIFFEFVEVPALMCPDMTPACLCGIPNSFPCCSGKMAARTKLPQASLLH
jgi:hypothetical protein